MALLASLLSYPLDPASTAETTAAGGVHEKGEKCGRAGASVGGGGGEGSRVAEP